MQIALVRNAASAELVCKFSHCTGLVSRKPRTVDFLEAAGSPVAAPGASAGMLGMAASGRVIEDATSNRMQEHGFGGWVLCKQGAGDGGNAAMHNRQEH
jgi:hypothetical protein